MQSKICVEPGCEAKLKLGKKCTTLDSFAENAKNDKLKLVRERAADSHKVYLVKDQAKDGMYTSSEGNDKLCTPPSSKLAATMAVILDWQLKYPDDKIIGKFTTSKLIYSLLT